MSDRSTQDSSTDPRVDAALREYLEQLDRGHEPDPEIFLAQHAEIAGELRSLIAAEIQLRKLAAGDRAGEQAGEQAGRPGEKRSGDSTQSFARQGQETLAPQRGGAKRSGESDSSGLNQEFGRYRIVKALGKGAMGMVYLAEDTQLQRQVALKTPHFDQQPTEELLERFYREARAAATLRHPNICPVYDVGQIDGTHYISMAFIEGNPLAAFIRAKPQPERQILIVVRKLAQALEEAHEHGIVHRDLKPANIMIDKRNEPIIMDFGLARQLHLDKNIRLTQSGMLIGTPAYMSPEQVEGELDKIGASTDQYSLGVILYELLTGQLPFRGSLASVLAQVISKEATPPSQLRSGLDPRIETVCLTMMAKTPSERFVSLKTVADELAAILKSPAAKSDVQEKPAASSAASQAGDRMPANAGASQVLKSLKPKAVTESGLASLEELAGKCYSRRDFEQVIQIIERIPEERRNTALQSLLEKSRGKADDIAFLICEIDEALRLNDRERALKKADELLAIKPGHHRALKVQKEFAGYGTGGAARIGTLRQFTQPWNEGGWIPWSALAFGLAVFGVMTAVVVVYLGRTAVIIDIKDPGVAVAVKGTTLTVTGPDKQSVKVEPGDQELTITYGELKFTTKSFTLKRGETKTVTILVVDSKVLATLEKEFFPVIPSPGHAVPKGQPLAKEEPAKARENKVEVGKSDMAKPQASKIEAGKAAAIPKAQQNKIEGGDAAVSSLLTAPFDEAAAKSAQQAWAARLKTTIERTNSIGMKLVLIPPGTFAMGSPKEEQGHGENEDLVRVTLTKGFWLGQHEVTQTEWRRVMQTTPWVGKVNTKRGNDYPATNVNWADAVEFCTKMTEIDRRAGLLRPGSEYGLPTEAQWEYACRAGTTTRYAFGDDEEDLPSHGWFKKNAIDVGQKYPHRVGRKKSNAWGLFDMHGNVWEWCRDAYQKKLPGGRDPEVSSRSSVRVNRSGCWGNPGESCRSACRYGRPLSESRRDSLGFRIACSSSE